MQNVLLYGAFDIPLRKIYKSHIQTFFHRVMKKLILLAFNLIVLLMSSCSGMNDRMEKMIPADATGVLVIDLPSILSKAKITDGERVLLPQSLQTLIDQNDNQAFCGILNDLPVMGLDTESKVYAFTSEKSFSLVGLIPLSDENAARKVMTQRMGAEFEMVESLSSIFSGEYLCAIDDHVLLVGRMGTLMDRKQATLAALSILKAKAKSIVDVDDVKDCIDQEAELNAYLTPASAKVLTQMEPENAEVSPISTLLGLIAQTDVKALTCRLNINENDAVLNTQIIAAENSDFVTLMNAVMSKPGSDFLEVVPESMEHIFSFSLNGQSMSSMPMMQQLSELMKKLPGSSTLDLRALVGSINGPVAVAGAPDPNLPGVWNMTLAVQCSDPDSLLMPLADYASSMQQPEMRGEEYIYQYDNMMITMGNKGKVVYLKMLDYDMQEESAAKNADLKSLFASSPMVISSRYVLGSAHATFTFNLKDALNGEGVFKCDDKSISAAEALLMTLCSIRPSTTNVEEDEMASVVPMFN